MGIYKEGLNRKQQLMFPPSLDELVNPKRFNEVDLNQQVKQSVFDLHLGI